MGYVQDRYDLHGYGFSNAIQTICCQQNTISVNLATLSTINKWPFFLQQMKAFHNKWLIKCIDSTVLCGILEQSRANSLNISNQTWNYIIFSFNLRSLVTVVLIDFRTYFTQFSNLLERSFYSNKIAEC